MLWTHVLLPTQSIYFSTGRTADPSTWSQPRVAVPPFQGKYAVWGPVLHYAEDARELWLFYSRSGAFNSRGPGRNYPGGDVMLSTSSDGGMSWSSARVIYAFASAARGNASKVTANKLAKLADGTLLLPVWSEVHVATNTGASCAHVLRSTDNGATWTPHACLQNPDTWLIENSLAPTADGRVYQVFRTSVGKLYASKSVDRSGEQWPNATATALLNPNSKTFLFALDGDAGLVLAYNPSSSARTPLALAVSRDSGATFTEYVTLDDGGGACCCFHCCCARCNADADGVSARSRAQWGALRTRPALRSARRCGRRTRRTRRRASASLLLRRRRSRSEARRFRGRRRPRPASARGRRWLDERTASTGRGTRLPGVNGAFATPPLLQ